MERERGMEARRGAVVGRARPRREGSHRSVRVQEREQREEASGSSEGESSDEGGSEEEDVASGGEEPSTPERIVRNGTGLGDQITLSD
eukprot:7295013-Prymnesium_polylepis.1